jgi:carboxymethylenebutenolidase
MPETRRLQHQITSGFIHVVTDDKTQIRAFWAHPVTGGPFPGLILAHDDWGLSAVGRTQAHRFAEIGYYVIVPDLFEGQLANSQIEADSLELRFKEYAPTKVVGGLTALETHPKCNSKLAVVGWDLGAELALQLAIERNDIMAAVALSGDLSAFLGDLERLQCPLLVVMGGEDPITQRSEQALRQALDAVDERSQVIVYPEAEHAFYNHLSSAYKAEAAEDAQTKILDFLEMYQGKPPAPDDAVPGRFRHGRVY